MPEISLALKGEAEGVDTVSSAKKSLLQSAGAPGRLVVSEAARHVHFVPTRSSLFCLLLGSRSRCRQSRPNRAAHQRVHGQGRQHSESRLHS